MDTSNSKSKDKKTKTVHLDEMFKPNPQFDVQTTWNPVHFVKMGLKIPYDEISAEGWMEIIKWVLGIYKPYLDYFPFIRELGKPLSGGSHGPWGNVADRSRLPDEESAIVYWNDNHGLIREARLLPLTPLFLNLKESKCPKGGTESDTIEEKYLFFADGIGFVGLKRLLEKRSSGANRAWRWGVSEICYFMISEEELQGMIKQWSWVGPAIIQAFGRLASQAIATKEMHLAHLKKAREDGLKVEMRIA